MSLALEGTPLWYFFFDGLPNALVSAEDFVFQENR
jgi:hypothetical protein